MTQLPLAWAAPRSPPAHLASELYGAEHAQATLVEQRERPWTISIGEISTDCPWR